MKRPDGYAVAFLTIMVTLIIVALIGFFTSCQPTDPLAGLNCPCKVISAELTYRGHEVIYIDKDGKLRKPVISKALYDQYQIIK